MIADKHLIERICQNYGLEPNNMFVEYVLQIYGREPFPHTWTEQDLFEQIRKLIMRYSSGDLQIRLKSREELWHDEREILQTLYTENRKDYTVLVDHLYELEQLLKEADITLPNAHLDF